MRGVRRSTPISRVGLINGSGSWKRTSTATEHAQNQHVKMAGRPRVKMAGRPRVKMAGEQSERGGA
jgi:hypothetical protein